MQNPPIFIDKDGFSRFAGRRLLGAGRWALVLASCALLFGLDAHAQGQSGETAAALLLYGQAIEAMDVNDFASACPKLEEALRLDPRGIGARLKLAECYEGDGKLASAWANYAVAEAASAQANQPARQRKAQDRMDVLRPKLAQITIEVPDEVRILPGLQIHRDGTVVGAGQWGARVPIDKGDHVLDVSARGKVTVHKRFRIEIDGSAGMIRVPMPPDYVVPPPPVSVNVTDPSFKSMLVPGPGTPLLHILADNPNVALAEVTGTNGGDDTTEIVCRMPCDRVVDGRSGRRFFFGGAGVTPSSGFHLDDKTGQVTVKVQAGNRIADLLGLGLVGPSAGLTFTSTMLLAINHNSSDKVGTYGAMLGLSTAVLAGALILKYTIGKTTYLFKGSVVKF